MTELPAPRRGYITEFDALRFFAAILTAVYHADVVKYFYGAPDRPATRSWDHVGSHCVTFFFVLSGFLITWLLFKEKDRTNRVDVKAFYLRRVFRIWPLYYLIMLLGLLVVPETPILFLPSFVYSELSQLTVWTAILWLTFFPNLHKVDWITPQLLVSHTWSIGMEEQFYGVWPWIVKKARRPERIFIGVLVAFLAVRWGIYRIMPSKTFMLAINHFRFDCMATGGLLAWAYYFKPHWRVFDLLKRPVVLYLLAVASLGFTLFKDPLFEVTFTPALSGLYGSLLLALAFQPGRMTWLNHPVLRYLGQISYGIYMYNVLACMTAITIMLRVFHGVGIFGKGLFWVNPLFYAMSLGLTVLFSGLSYRFIEAPFLRLKDRLAQPTAVPAKAG